MYSDIRSLRRRIEKAAQRALAAAGLKPHDKVTIVLAPTAPALAALRVTVAIERRYDAQIEAVLLSSNPLLEEALESETVPYRVIPAGRPTPTDVLAAALRERLRGRVPITTLTADDIALAALADALQPPSVNAVLEVLAKPAHSLVRISAAEASAYAEAIDPRANLLPRTLYAPAPLLQLLTLTDPHAPRSLHQTLARTLDLARRTRA